MLIQIFLVTAVSNFVRCSMVIDAESQKGIHISDYCPKMKYCPEGAHVMCMYYNPNSVIGPRCRDYQNVTMAPEMAKRLVEVTNEMRSKIARGEEKGQNGEPLPRGYGIFRLKWDSELATFAQVLANQCVLRHDLCRATKKFPDPGQTAGLVRYSVPDWIPVSRPGDYNTPGLTRKKLMYAVMQTLRSWHGQKRQVTPDMVTNYPDWSKDPKNRRGHLYMEIIYGSSTHMGCGISAYSDYSYYNDGSPLNYNSVLIICNFSARPHAGTAVFNTVPPTDTESPFNPCGCPVGNIEDTDCLCIEDSKEPEPSKSHTCTQGIDCDPTVVLLPIFTVEDAPPDRLSNISKRRSHIEINGNNNDSFEQLLKKRKPEDKAKESQIRKTLEIQPHANLNAHNQSQITGKGVPIYMEVGHAKINHNNITDHGSVKNMHNTGYYGQGNNVIFLDEHTYLANDTKYLQRLTNNASSYSKTSIILLPGTRIFTTKSKDVIPQMMFYNNNQLGYEKNNIFLPTVNPKMSSSSRENVLLQLSSFETERLNQLPHNAIEKYDKKNQSGHHETVHFHDILTTESHVQAEEHNVVKNNEKPSNTFDDYEDFETSAKARNSNKKIMALLDVLETEVKHINLPEHEKEMFHNKLKNIVKSLTAQSDSALLTKRSSHTDYIREAQNQYINNEDDTEVRVLPPSFDIRENENMFVDEPSYRRYDFGVNEKISKHFIESDPQNTKSPAKSTNRKYTRQRKSYIRPSQNERDSSEHTRQRYDNGFIGRKSQKSFNLYDIYKKNDKMYNKDYDEFDNDPLNIERRKYYQDKLDSMERKLQDAKRHSNTKKNERKPHIRPLKASIRSINQINPVFAGRARILHGY